ncbi:MAG: TetR/AcrR family transcriptional regulator [Actinomycetota bacterium]
MPKVSVEHKEAVRRRLIDAARTVVLREGWQGTSARAIMAEADVSTGTLYHYFSSTEDLYEEVAEDILRSDLEALLAAGDARRILELVLTLPGDAVGALAWFRGRVTDDPDTQRAIARLNAWILDAFRPVAAMQGAPQVPDVDALIELIDIVWDGMGRRAAMGTFQTSYERVGAACMRLINGSND